MAIRILILTPNFSEAVRIRIRVSHLGVAGTVLPVLLVLVALAAPPGPLLGVLEGIWVFLSSLGSPKQSSEPPKVLHVHSRH